MDPFELERLLKKMTWEEQTDFLLTYLTSKVNCLEIDIELFEERIKKIEKKLKDYEPKKDI